MAATTLIFGGIGTLVETSTYQRLAFNRAFAKLGIDFAWSAGDYAASLSDTGGEKRLAAIRLPGGGALTAAQIAAVHDAKTRLFEAILADERLPLRAGAAGLIAAARDHGIPLAWATTTSRANIDAVIAATGGALTAGMFVFVGDDRQVQRQKPDPEIYTKILTFLAADPAQAIAIEDSPTGVRAARAAGVHTVAFPGEMHRRTDFAAADSVVETLGDVAAMLLR